MLRLHSSWRGVAICRDHAAYGVFANTALHRSACSRAARPNFSMGAIDIAEPMWHPPSCWRPLCVALPPANALALVPRFVHLTPSEVDNDSSRYGHMWEFLEAFFECVVQQGPLSIGLDPTSSLATVILPLDHPAKRGLSSPLFAMAQELFSIPGSIKFPSRRTGLLIVRRPWLESCTPCYTFRHLLHEGAPILSTDGAAAHCDQWLDTRGIDLLRTHQLSWRKHSNYTHCCRQEQRCCELTNKTRQGMEEHAQKHRQPLGVAELFVSYDLARGRLHSSNTLHAMRRAVWANHAPGTDGVPVDLVLLVSSQCASNRRILINEDALAAALQSHVAISHPSLCFMRVTLESLSLSDEMQLLRRTRVLISLFSSSLHNCRFLPPEAAVLEIFGAVKGELHSGLMLYDDICRKRMQLRWALFTAVETCRDSTAHVEPAAFVAFFDTVLRGEWSHKLEMPRAIAAAEGVLQARKEVERQHNASWHKTLCRAELERARNQTQSVVRQWQCAMWRQRGFAWRVRLRTVLRDAAARRREPGWTTAKSAAAVDRGQPAICGTARNVATL